MKLQLRLIEWQEVSTGASLEQSSCAIEVAEDQPAQGVIEYALRWAKWDRLTYQISLSSVHGVQLVHISVPSRQDDLLTITLPLSAKFDFPVDDLTTFQAMNQTPEKTVSRMTVLCLWLLCLPAMAYALVRMLWCAFRHPSKGMDIAIAVDRAANAALNGSPHETISSRANRARLDKRTWGCVLCKVLDWFQKGHCEKSAGK